MSCFILIIHCLGVLYSLAVQRPLDAFVFDPEVASQTWWGREGTFTQGAREPLQLLKITTFNTQQVGRSPCPDNCVHSLLRCMTSHTITPSHWFAWICLNFKEATDLFMLFGHVGDVTLFVCVARLTLRAAPALEVGRSRALFSSWISCSILIFFFSPLLPVWALHLHRALRSQMSCRLPVWSLNTSSLRS